LAGDVATLGCALSQSKTDGTYCLTLDSKSPDRVDYQSREAPRGAPQLIVDVAP